MSHEWPDDVRRELDSCRALEEIGGRRYAAATLMREAATYFERGDDDKAKMLRNLAKQFTLEGDELREAFDEKFHPEGLPGMPKKKKSMGFGQGGNRHV